jgi:hypothetical protein
MKMVWRGKKRGDARDAGRLPREQTEECGRGKRKVERGEVKDATEFEVEVSEGLATSNTPERGWLCGWWSRYFLVRVNVLASSELVRE